MVLLCTCLAVFNLNKTCIVIEANILLKLWHGLTQQLHKTYGAITITYMLLIENYYFIQPKFLKPNSCSPRQKCYLWSWKLYILTIIEYLEHCLLLGQPPARHTIVLPNYRTQIVYFAYSRFNWTAQYWREAVCYVGSCSILLWACILNANCKQW